MRRIHFLEIEDQPWCPAVIRNAATDYLQFVVEKTNPFAAVTEKISQTLGALGNDSIVDLCSGGGGAWRCVLPTMIAERPGTQVRLTDRFPNKQAFATLKNEFPNHIAYSDEEIDAATASLGFHGLRTLFNSFHHFRPAEARRILENAVNNNEGIAVFEFTQRKLPAIVGMLLTPLIVLLVTPFIRPFSISRLIWTYLIPIVPFVIGFDGIVSCLRTYTVAEMRELSANLSDAYMWETGEIPVEKSIVPISFLIGRPRPTSESEQVPL